MDDIEKKEELEINKEEIKQEEKEIVEVAKEETKSEANTKYKEPEKDRKGLAIAAMVLGIVALVLFCIWYISIPCAILSIIFGILSLKSSRRGMAIAGISTGAVGVILTIILYVFIFVVVGVGTYSGLKNLIEDYEDYNYNHNYNYRYDRYDDYNDYDDWF